jgi:hypothetical protein
MSSQPAASATPALAHVAESRSAATSASLGIALDRHHPTPLAPRPPAVGSDADLATLGACAIIGALRVAPQGMQIAETIIAADGTVIFTVRCHRVADKFAANLGLGDPRPAHLEGEPAARWSGVWADQPITIWAAPAAPAPAPAVQA